MSTVFVTGGSGFVGRNLIRHLKARGDTVRALARSDAAAAAVRAADAEPVKGDLEDFRALREGLTGCSVVYHAAAEVNEWGPRERFHQINVVGTQTLLTAARAAGVKKFVHVSTEAALCDGSPLRNVNEGRPLPAKPLPRYPESKGQAEKCVVEANSPQMETVVVRPRLIWGTGDTSLLPQLIKSVQDGRFMWVSGGTFLTSTTHVDNVCEGLLRAADRGRGGQVYFVTDGAPVEFRSFLTALFATQGVVPKDKRIPHFIALAFAAACEWLWDTFGLKGQPPATRMAVRLGGEEVTVDDSKARRELGYQGKVTREAG
ncbi:MAG: NAD-dependent epimerase/dehydratase family protein, partial [Nevskiales bacterium]